MEIFPEQVGKYRLGILKGLHGVSCNSRMFGILEAAGCHHSGILMVCLPEVPTIVHVQHPSKSGCLFMARDSICSAVSGEVGLPKLCVCSPLPNWAFQHWHKVFPATRTRRRKPQARRNGAQHHQADLRGSTAVSAPIITSRETGKAPCAHTGARCTLDALASHKGCRDHIIGSSTSSQ